MAKTNKTQEAKTTQKATKEAAVTVTENKSKRVTVPQLTNEELCKLFRDNNCGTYTQAKSDSVVYNTFATKSRVLQQGGAYQLLLTNGHKEVKKEIVACDNDDTARFIQFYEGLSKEEQAMVPDYSTLTSRKLSAGELPRERSCKLTSYDLLVKFLQFMGGFEENTVSAIPVKVPKKTKKQEAVPAATN